MLSPDQLARIVDCHAHPRDTPKYDALKAKDAQIGCAKVLALSESPLPTEREP
jgi:hypothetical protein